MKSVLVVGGGLSGLITAIDLAYHGVVSTVIEKQVYPFHRVCGEYVSNEVLPYLKSVNLLPDEFLRLPVITRFQLSSTRGNAVILPLDLGGFGISRYTLDHYLYLKACELGVNVRVNEMVESVSFHENKFEVKVNGRSLFADVVVGAYGKRSKLDMVLNRKFIDSPSPYMGVKYHVKTQFPADLIALHNFRGGYCGVSRVENGSTNVCYLTHREPFRTAGGIKEFEEKVLFQNPHIKKLFSRSTFVFEKPLTINEISFATKSAVEDHVLMTGDAAGMITPLCGNGMAMAIHSAKLASSAIRRFVKEPSISRQDMEAMYAREWRDRFAGRLAFGRRVQRLFGRDWSSSLAINLALNVRPLSRMMIRQSHGKPF